MKLISFFVLPILATLGASAVSCKPINNSAHEKNLQMITSGKKVSRNNWQQGGCGGVVRDKDFTAQEARERAYSALPPMLQKVFLERDFKLLSEAEVRAKCKAVMDASVQNYPGLVPSKVSEAASYLDGCWVSEDAPNAQGTAEKKPVIYLTATQEAVHNSMGALASYAFFEFYVDEFRNNAMGIGASAEVRDAAVAFDALARERTAITETLVTELAATNQGRTALDGYKKTLVPGADLGSGYSALVSNRVFQNFVLAELMDSFYCNASTWGSFSVEGLAKTRARFDTTVREWFGEPWFARPNR
jgi:hypothetical protein